MDEAAQRTSLPWSLVTPLLSPTLLLSGTNGLFGCHWEQELRGPPLAPNCPCLWKQITLGVQPRTFPLNSLLLSASIWRWSSSPALGCVCESLWLRSARRLFQALRVKPSVSPADIYLHFMLFFLS